MRHLLATLAASHSIDLSVSADELLKLLIAIVCGGLIGIEREYRDKAAGFRTLIFICLGSTLFTLFSVKIATGSGADPSRIASTIVSGVGFLGAGVILHQKGQLVGLTTAAVVWLVAALGIGIGIGEIALAIAGTVTAMTVLLTFPLFERRFTRLRDRRNYEIHFDMDPRIPERLEQLFHDHGMIISHRRKMKRDSHMVCHWQLLGTTNAHQTLTDQLISDPEIHEFHQ